MNPLIKFIQKRPSDLTIRLIRIIFGLLYIGVLYYNFFINQPLNEIQDNLFWIPLTENGREIMKYVVTSFGIFPLFMGITNMCVAKSKYIRIAQIVYSIILFYFSGIIIESADLDIDALILFLGFIPLFAGITGKLIPSKCLNYGYKQTKIRV